MKKKIYLIGAGGAGMSAVAKYLYKEGYSVSGSDAAHSETIIDLQENYGFDYKGDHDANNIQVSQEAIIYTPAVGPGNPEYDKAVALQMKMYSYPEFIGVISENKRTIAIAGTNGKTTTTTMVGEVLVNAGLDPTIIVGGVMTAFGTNYKEGNSDLFVVEACEYKNSFLSLSPETLVITNITPDHLDFFKTVENYKQVFVEFVKKMSVGNTLICNQGDPELIEVIFQAKKQGINIIDYTDLNKPELQIPGSHNVQNAQAALAVGHVYGVQVKNAQTYLEHSFKGSGRRFEYRGDTHEHHQVFDDYAHNPEAIETLVTGIRERYPKIHIVMFFQPHLFSRTQDLFIEFVRTLGLVDTQIVLPIYRAREEDDGSMSSIILSEAIRIEHPSVNVSSPNNFKEAVDIFKNLKLPKDTIVLTVGAGDVNKIADMLLEE